MFRLMFAFMLTATMLAGYAQSADPVYGVKHTEERIVKLPQDGDKFYLTVFGSIGDTRYESVKGWFKEVPELAAFKSQTHFHSYTVQSTEFKQRYQKTMGSKTFPVILVQMADGTPLCELKGNEIPMSGQALTKHLNTECLRRWRERCKPCPAPDPDPAPVPDEDNPGPDENKPEPAPVPVDDSPSVLVLVLIVGLGLAAGGGSAAVKMLKDHSKVMRG